MKEFIRVQFNLAQCRRDLDDFRALLASKQDLDEEADIKPFFENHWQLATFIGSCYGWEALACDLLAFQYQLFGDFGCDLVVGDSHRKTFAFVEWEDGTVGSLFRQQGKKVTPEWASRLEH